MRVTELAQGSGQGFGFGLVNMAATPFDRQTFSYALPSVNLAAMPARSGGESAGLDEATQRQVEEAQRAGPYALANRLGVDEGHPAVGFRCVTDRIPGGGR